MRNFVPRSSGRARIAILGLLPFLAAPWSFAQPLVDDFATSQGPNADPPGPGSSSSVAAAGLGGERDLFVIRTGGSGTVTAQVAGGLVGVTFAAPAGTKGRVQIAWDGGDGDPATLDPTGLGGVDLTAGGGRGFQLTVASADAGAQVILEVLTSASSGSRVARVLPAVSSTTEFFLGFGAFQKIPGAVAAADFTDVGAIRLTLLGTDQGVSLDGLRAAAPSVTATMVDVLAVDADVDGRADPGDTLRYTVTIENAGGDATGTSFDTTLEANLSLASGSVKTTPLARDDAYDGFGNVSFTVPAPGLLANDADFDGGAVTVDLGASQTTTSAGASVSYDGTDGGFTYTPAPGFSGVDSFTYTIADADSNLTTGTVTLVLDGLVWFVDDTAPGPGTGTLSDPFVDFVALNGASGAGDVDAPGDVLYLRTGSGATDTGGTNGLELEAGQQLLGEGVALVVAGNTIVPAGTAPTLANADGAGVTLGSGNTLRGLDVDGTAGTAIAGASVGNLTIASMSVAGAGNALDLANGSLSVSFDGVASTGTGGGRGIRLDGVSGSLSVALSTTVTNPTGDGILVTNSPGANVSFGATTLTDFAIGSGSSGDGVELSSNAGATFTFSSLSVTSDGGRGLVASNGGTVNIESTATINATGGAAVDIASTSGQMSGASGWTFQSLTSTNSTGVGVSLSGLADSFTVNGGSITGAAGTAFSVSGGDANVTFSAPITKSGAGRIVDVQGRSGGTVDFNGAILATGAGNGIRISGATAASTVRFDGTVDLGTSGNRLSGGTALTINHNGQSGAQTLFADLDVFTSGQTALQAMGGGSVSVTTGRLDASGATAVDLNGVTAGITFATVTATGATTGASFTSTGGSFTALGGSITATGAGRRVAAFGGTNTGTYDLSGVTLNGNGSEGITLGSGQNGGFSFGDFDVDTPNAANGVSVLDNSGNVTFKSIDSNGGTKTIVSLSNTTGTFTVTGVGTTAGSGGTIQNISSADAVRLDDTGGRVTLANMILQDVSHPGDAGAPFHTRSGVDAIHGQNVNGGLTLRGTTIRRVSDNAVNGALFSDGVSATVWNGLEIMNSLLENTNRFHVPNVGDDSDEGMVRIVGLRGTVLVENSTLQDGAELLDLFATGGVLNMDVRSSSFNRAFQEYTSGTIANVGKACVDLTIQGNTNAAVAVGDGLETNPSLGNAFLNCATASIQIASDAGTSPATGDVDVTVSRNTFRVNDHSSALGTSGNFPQGGVALVGRGTASVTFDAIVSHNTFGVSLGPNSTTDEIMNASGGIGNLTLSFDSGVGRARVEANAFNGPINAPWFLRADGNTSATVLLTGNLYNGRPDFTSPDPGFGTFNVPGIPAEVQVRNGGSMELTIENENYHPHELRPGLCCCGGCNEQTIRFISSSTGGGNLGVHVRNVSSPNGFDLTQGSVGVLRLYRGTSASSAPPTIFQDNLCRGGGASYPGDPNLLPPTVEVNGSVTVVSGTPPLPGL